MRQNKLRSSATLPIAGLCGLLAGFVIILVLFAIAAFFVSTGKIPESLMRSLTCVCAFVGSLAGSLIAAGSYAHRRFLVGIGHGLSMFLICFIIAAISPVAKFPSRWHLVLLVVFILGGALGGIISARVPSRRR